MTWDTELQELYDDCLVAEMGDVIPKGLVNRETGLPPTPAEWIAIKAHAAEILSNPYASPESVAWAMDILPEGIAIPFDKAMKNQQRREKLLGRP